MGATFSLPEKDRYGYGLKWLRATMRVVCGGRIAEQRKTDDISSGAAMDIQQLTTLARSMVLEWGMSDKLGFVRYTGTDSQEAYVPDRDFSEETAKLIDDEIRAYAKEAFDDAERMLNENWDKVIAVAEALLRHETLSSDDVEKLMRGERIDKPTVSDLLDAEIQKKDEPASEPGKGARETGDDFDTGGMLPSPA